MPKADNNTAELTAEIFAVGRWNGYEFGLSDLQEIAANFAKFNDVLKVPLKMGHNKEQPMTDGQPALGWVKDVWVEGQKLMAKFADMPAVVMAAIKKKLYRKVSIELDLDVEYKGQPHNFVLSGVALLGADIPAVSTLSDLDAFLASARAAFSKRERLCFEAIAGDLNSKEYDMDVKELSDKIVALSAQVAELTAKNTELATKVTAFEADEAKRSKAEKAALMSAKRTEVNALFDGAVKSGAITPAQKIIFCKSMRIEDDAALEALDVADVKALFGTAKFGAESGKGSGADTGTPDQRPADVIVAERAHALVASGKAVDFSAAVTQVIAADRGLGKLYTQLNMEA